MKIILDYRLDKPTERVQLPQQATIESAGFDLVANIDKPLNLSNGVYQIRTGVRLDLRGSGLFGLVSIRSGWARLGLNLANGVGIIDADYQGEIVLLINKYNLGLPEQITINPQDRIAQIVFLPYHTTKFEVVEAFTGVTVRGVGGFGSTGTSGTYRAYRVSGTNVSPTPLQRIEAHRRELQLRAKERFAWLRCCCCSS